MAFTPLNATPGYGVNPPTVRQTIDYQYGRTPGGVPAGNTTPSIYAATGGGGGPANMSSGGDLGRFQDRYTEHGDIQRAIQAGLGRTANQAAPQLDPVQQAQFRAMQMQQAQHLQGVASGQIQGAGELAVQRQMQQALAGQQAMAMAQRGGNAGLAYRNAARNSAGIGLSGAGQGQLAAMQDQQGAQGQLMNALNQGRSSDLGLAGSNANLQQQQYGLNNQAQLGYLGQYGNMNQAELAARMGQVQPSLAGPLISAGGAVLGAYVGGPAGAAAGTQVGRAVG